MILGHTFCAPEKMSVEEGMPAGEIVDDEKGLGKLKDMSGARPERHPFENPLTWWGDTPWFMWNFKYGGFLGIWSGASRGPPSTRAASWDGAASPRRCRRGGGAGRALLRQSRDAP